MIGPGMIFIVSARRMAKDSFDGDGQIEQFGYYDYTWLQAVYSNGISPFNKKEHRQIS